MSNSISNTPDSPRETTEAFREAAKTVSKVLGLTFVQEEAAANSAPINPATNNLSVDDEKYNQSKSNMRTQMLEAGLSQEAIAYAERMADLRREFIQEALKLKNESVSPPVIITISSEEANKHYKQSEEAVAEMLSLRKQAQQPSNTDTHKKKPD